MLYFSWIDYLVLVGVICISVMVGIYYGCFGKKQNSTDQYLLGGRKMKAFPIAMSLTASHISGITLLGVPAEIYFFGTQYMVCPITIVMLIFLVIYVFLPVFYNLQLSSSFEYLKLRFGHSTRTLASFLYTLSTLLYIPIVVYVPSLTLNQVTGISLYLLNPVICAVCIFYTTLGGLKAVVLSDTIQFSITSATMVAICVIGSYQSGGVLSIWEKAKSRDRLEFFKMTLNPTERQTFWGIVIGMGVINLMNWGINPSSIQRFLSISTYKEAKRSMVIFAIISIFIKLVSCFMGLVIFARYIDCDPFSTGAIKRIDQLLPFYILDAMSHLQGFSGLFIASVLCTAFSTMSTNINTLALTIYEDFIKSKLPQGTSQNAINVIIKSIVVISGIACLTFTFIVEKLGGVLQIALSFHGLTLGPLVGLNSLGMIFPYSNEKGALIGGICAITLTGIVAGGAQIYTYQGKIKHTYKPLSTTGCDFVNSTLLATTTSIPEVITEKPPVIFLLSYLYYSVLGMVLTVVIGLLVSWATKKQDDRPVDRDLLSPCIYRFLSKDEKLDKELQEIAKNKPIKVENQTEQEIVSKLLVNNAQT